MAYEDVELEAYEYQEFIEILLRNVAFSQPVDLRESDSCSVTGDVGMYVHQKIDKAMSSVCEAMMAMQHNEPVNANDPFDWVVGIGRKDGREVSDAVCKLLNSPVYSELLSVLQALHELNRHTEPVITTRF